MFFYFSVYFHGFYQYVYRIPLSIKVIIDVQPFGLMAIIGGLHYFEIIDVLAISERIFYGLYQNIGFFIIPIVVLLVYDLYFLFHQKEFVSGQRFRNEKSGREKPKTLLSSINMEH